LLPIAQKKSRTDEEMELNDDDFVIVDSEDLAATVLRVQRPASRRMLDEHIEEDVAGQCLASIAAETSRDSYSSSHFRVALAAVARPVDPPIAPSASNADADADLRSMVEGPPSSRGATSTRLPSVSPPPFVRPALAARVPFVAHTTARPPALVAPGVLDSTPPAAFVRRSSPILPVAAPSSSSHVNVGSVAPVSMSQAERAREPTVILVREPPRAAWIVAAAAFGAAIAIGAMRFTSAPAADPAGAAPPPQAPVALPPTAVVAPVAVPAHVAAIAPPPSLPAPAVVRFSDDQGVAIKAPAPQPVARKGVPSAPSVRPAGNAPPAPRASSMGPALPDGSFGLGRAETSSPPPAPPSLTAPAPEPRKRVLTAEQQLAEAQLKASMK
jgi:hypothetical protein